MQLPKELNLTPNQEKIYLEYLGNGENTAAFIARKVGIDKTTAYRAVEELEKRGLLIKHPRQRGTTYIAADPDILKELMNEKKNEIEIKTKNLTYFIEQLKKGSVGTTHKSRIKIEKGMEAHNRLMLKSLNAKDKTIRSKFNKGTAMFSSPEYEKFIREEFLPERIKKKVFYKHLYTPDVPDYVFDDIEFTSEKLQKEVRITPWELKSSDNLRIFDDTVQINVFDSKGEVTVYSIEDKFVADLLKEMFDFIWERSSIYYGKTKLPTKKLGNSTVATLGIGSWGIGGYWLKNPYNDDQNDIQQLQHSISKGENYIDASLCYAENHSVDLIAKAIKHYPRKDLYINAKLTYQNGKEFPQTTKDIDRQVQTYLHKLNTTYLDSLMIHSPKHTFPLGMKKTMSHLDALVDKGVIKSISVSNFSVPHLKEALKYTKHGIVANEMHYNLMIRAAEEVGVIDFCDKHNIMIITYQPLRRGYLCSLEEDPTVGKLAEKYKKTPGQIAINWLAFKSNNMVICKSTNGSHINENVAALDWEMTKEDYKSLDDWRMPGYSTPSNFDPDYTQKEGTVTWASL